MSKKLSNTSIYDQLKREFISDNIEKNIEKTSDKLNMLLLVTDDGLGDHTSSLSTHLKSGLIKALAQKEPYPSVIIFMNRGVFLTLESSDCLDVLRTLESRGVLILSNCTCLDYYKVMDKLAVGGVTNLYHIAELIKLAKNTVSL